MSDSRIAKKLISCLDLTSLHDNDDEAQIDRLCHKACTPYGETAAVCVYPKWVFFAKKNLKRSNVKVATVVNFPEGKNDLRRLKDETRKAIQAGADEIDAVFPYHNFLAGDETACRRFLEIFKRECQEQTSKIILETGEYKHISQIAAATKLCLEYDVNFIKTSTGKTPTSATIGAANIILETIRDSNKNVGFKASGGIRDFEEARKYLTLSEIILGEQFAQPQNFRIGASSLLDDLIKVIEGDY